MANQNIYPLFTASQKDSIYTIMNSLQAKHTQRMVEIISIYGYPDPLRLKDSVTKCCAAILLSHIDQNFSDTMLKLMDKELANGHIDINQYEMTKWNINGRAGIPNLKGISIIKLDAKTGNSDIFIN